MENCISTTIYLYPGGEHSTIPQWPEVHIRNFLCLTNRHLFMCSPLLPGPEFCLSRPVFCLLGMCPCNWVDKVNVVVHSELCILTLDLLPHRSPFVRDCTVWAAGLKPCADFYGDSGGIPLLGLLNRLIVIVLHQFGMFQQHDRHQVKITHIIMRNLYL
jgi:hypothetical protein